jgi:hypothetical protein
LSENCQRRSLGGSQAKYPETLHYRGEGVFMISGRSISLRRKFKAQNL